MTSLRIRTLVGWAGLMVLVFAGAFGSEAAGAPRRHRVEDKDTLWDLAGRYYKDAWRWPKIWEANKAVVQDPDLILPGQDLVIPDIAPAAPAGPPAGAVSAPQTPQKAAVPAAEQNRSEPPPSLDFPPSEEPSPSPKEQVSSELPPQMTGMFPSLPKATVPLDWEQDGRVVGTGREDPGIESLAIQGDSVRLRLLRAIPPGTRLDVFRKAGFSRNENGERTGVELQRIARLNVISVGRTEADGTEARADVVGIHDAVQIGDYVKISP